MATACARFLARDMPREIPSAIQVAVEAAKTSDTSSVDEQHACIQVLLTCARLGLQHELTVEVDDFAELRLAVVDKTFQGVIGKLSGLGLVAPDQIAKLIL